MEGARKKTRESCVFAALWGVPGLLTLIEAYRLAGLPKLQGTSLTEGPVGYMICLGSLLTGFSLWEIITGLRQGPARAPSGKSTGTSFSGRIWFTIAYMILFLAMVPILGFILASGIFLVGTLRLLGCSVSVVALTVSCYCGGLYWMVPLLGLSLPRGILGI